MWIRYFVSFLLLRKFRRKTTVQNYIRRTYGEETLKKFYNFYDVCKKVEKCKLDIEFLTLCKAYEIFPKFLRFKLYKECLHRKKFYKQLQVKLLNNEIKFKRNREKEVLERRTHCEYLFKNSVSVITFIIVRKFVICDIDKFVTNTQTVHERKLNNLGIYNRITPCDPDKVIINLSSKQLTNRVKYLLAFGLDFGLPIFKLDFVKYFYSFESFVAKVKFFNCINNHVFNYFLREIKYLSFKYFYNFKPYKVFSAIISKKDLVLLKELSKDKSLVICKPDKGRGVVLMNKNDYLTKVYRILSDRTKF